MSQSTSNNRSRSERGPWLRRTTLAVVIASSIAATGGAMFAQAKMTDPGPIQPPSVQAPISGLADMVEQVRPAVVSVLVQGSVQRTRGPQFQFHGDERMRDFFEHFFGRMPDSGDGQAPEQHMQAAGSGFIVSNDGFIVTNNHVVSEGEDIKVVLDDGTELPAKLRGTDPKTDLALLKVDTDKTLPYVQFGESESTRPGDWVVSIGNPFGLGGTVTTGIISARGRDIHSGPYDDFLQIDAPINKGNSGGPLFDLQGQVIGVNTAILSPNGGNIGIGFAIPARQARSVIASLKDQGYVERGQLGVQIQTVTDELAEGLGLDEPRGALVADVVEDSPADRAGIKAGDVIIGFNGKPVDEMHELPRRVAGVAPGTETSLEVLRDGQTKRLDVTLSAQEKEVASASDQSGESDETRLGVLAAPVNQESRERFDLPQSATGAVVVRVQPGSAAALAGLRPGDVIREVNGKNIESPAQLGKAVQSDPKHLVMLVRRGGHQWFVSVDTSSMGLILGGVTLLFRTDEPRLRPRFVGVGYRPATHIMRVLHIEDDDRTAEFIARGLRESGHVAERASDGEDGLHRALQEEFDVLIVDRMLARVEGLEVVRRVRAAGRQTPALVLSALGEVDDRVAGLRAGGDDYLVKPFAFAELLARLEALFRRGESEAPCTSLACADLEMDLLAHKVRRAGSEIELQPREFRLLEHLLRNAGRVVTRTMLLEKVWDYAFDPQTNVIDVHMSRLRAKIDRGYSPPLLHTVRGAGYMLSDAG